MMYLRFIKSPALLSGSAPLAADALTQFQTKSNKLSIWKVDDPSTVQRIIACNAVTRQDLESTNHVIIDDDIFERLELRVQPSKVNEADKTLANEYHFDIVDLTAKQLISFVEKIRELSVEITLDNVVLDYVDKSIEQRFFTEDSLVFERSNTTKQIPLLQRIGPWRKRRALREPPETSTTT